MAAVAALAGCGGGPPPASEGYDFTSVRTEWRHVDETVRAGVLAGLVSRPNPLVVVVHSSASEGGGVSALDDNHRRVRGLDDGLAYHFVIGNGNGLGDGRIAVGRRWPDGKDGAALTPGHPLTRGSVAVCLIGDGAGKPFTPAQLRALDELLEVIEGRVGKIKVNLHREVEASPRGCPGPLFPVEALRQAYPL